VAIPAKSGVGGGVWMVVPNILGIAVWSPPLDENGNSVRGVMVGKELTSVYNFNDLLVKGVDRIDPTERISHYRHLETRRMLSAAATGMVRELEILQRKGGDLFLKDYDNRTPLHLACSEGRPRVVEYIVDQTKHLPKRGRAALLSPIDRWKRTPLDDAITYDNQAAVEYLQKAGARRGAGESPQGFSFRVLNVKKINRKSKFADMLTSEWRARRQEKSSINDIQSYENFTLTKSGVSGFSSLTTHELATIVG